MVKICKVSILNKIKIPKLQVCTAHNLADSIHSINKACTADRVKTTIHFTTQIKLKINLKQIQNLLAEKLCYLIFSKRQMKKGKNWFSKKNN